jgi:DNA-binding IclR family transcriptional regulator
MQNDHPPGVTAGGDGRRQGVQAIARAGAVLRALEQAPEGLGLGELAAAARLPKSTAHRIVAALAAEDLVDRAGNGRIRLGSGIAKLAAARREALGERLRPLLLDLRRELDETVDLAVLDGPSARFLDQVPAPRRLRAVSAIGEAFPLHCTANGKALLSALPERAALALLPERLPRLTPSTIVSRKKLMIELEGVRRSGVAFDREEHTEGICAVGVVVSDGVDPAAAAISVPVPTQRFRNRERHIAAALRRAAGAASELLASA